MITSLLMMNYRVIHVYSLLLFMLFNLSCNRTPPVPEQALVITPTQSPAQGDSREPELTTTQDGRVILSWVEKIDDKRHALRIAMLDGNGWTETRNVAEGDNWFVNWADFPSVTALKDGSLAAHWLVKSGSATYAYDVNVSQSKDEGQTWTTPIVPHRDNTQTEHGFVSLIPLSDGRLGAVWLDGRNMKNMNESDEHAPATESMTLRYAAIDSTGKLSDETELDERVCECCQTSAAVTSNGSIAVYRDRSANEMRDIQKFLLDLQSSAFGKQLKVAGLMHGLTKKANYVPGFPDELKTDLKAASDPGPKPYAVVIPIRKNADWWALDQESRAAMMKEHTEAALPYHKTVKRKLYHSTGLDDLDFITYFETSKLEDFHSLILSLEKVREYQYTRRFGHPTWLGTAKGLDEIIEILAQ